MNFATWAIAVGVTATMHAACRMVGQWRCIADKSRKNRARLWISLDLLCRAVRRPSAARPHECTSMHNALTAGIFTSAKRLGMRRNKEIDYFYHLAKGIWNYFVCPSSEWGIFDFVTKDIIIIILNVPRGWERAP
jgi:hypothetical protein